jgi:DNA-binding MarR family transcriptional regulator
MTDLARAPGVAPSTAGRMCDRSQRKGLIRRHRARTDRRAVQVSITAAGRQVVDTAMERRHPGQAPGPAAVIGHRGGRGDPR